MAENGYGYKGMVLFYLFFILDNGIWLDNVFRHESFFSDFPFLSQFMKLEA
ncbi:hypothetical protein [Priestia megaterium]|uniref:hypothetical protein n=1 Tax=Priestia megaterium TaxID=1404 RepID=UPI0004188422|nr:hypothetical protein [Priestia megaterium]